MLKIWRGKKKEPGDTINLFAHIRITVTCNLCLCISSILASSPTHSSLKWQSKVHAKPIFLSVLVMDTWPNTCACQNHWMQLSVKERWALRECQQCPGKARAELMRTAQQEVWATMAARVLPPWEFLITRIQSRRSQDTEQVPEGTAHYSRSSWGAPAILTLWRKSV